MIGMKIATSFLGNFFFMNYYIYCGDVEEFVKLAVLLPKDDSAVSDLAGKLAEL